MEEVSKVIKKIQNSLSSLNEVIHIIDSYRGLLSEFGINIKQEDLDEMERIKKDLEFYKTKLEKDIIEVAFVGLEKAGKSTLINAIISKNILPSDYKRTTYTITQIEYSPNPSVEVSFYSEEEFLKEVFRKMLKEVHYPNSESQTLDTVSIRDFEKHYRSLKEKDLHTYEKHETSLKNDIMEILEGKAEIKQLLGKGKIQASFTDFDKYKKYITNKHKSRAVKEIKILTDVLKGLENIVIYDLPGFDSPTLIHSKFTEEKIRRADAVVFVKEAENPSIRRTEVEMIQKTKENDGVELKEKTFYFCNMVDKISDKYDLQRIKQDFIDELNKYEIFQSEERIIYGSALAKLQRIGENDKTDAVIGIERLGISDGIQELLNKIKDYNQNERRKVIIRRINALMRKIEEFGEKVYKNIEDISRKDISMQQYKNIRYLEEESKKKIKEHLKNYQYEVKKIPEEKEISQKIKKSISENINPEILLDEEEIESIRKKVEMGTSTQESRPGAFNEKIRERLYSKIYESYSGAINKEIQVHFDKIKREIIEIFLKAFEIKPDVEEKFSQALEDFFKKKNIDFSSQKFSLDKLIERFGGDIIQLLILNPLTSKDRENKFKEIERDFYSLLAYHKDFNPDTKLSELKIVKTILYQENSSQIGNVSKEKAKNPINLILEGTKKIVPKKEEKLNTFTPKRPENYNEVINEVKTDIENLRNFMVDCIINAINIEKMITNQIISYIYKLHEIVDSIDYSDFISDNANYIKPELEEEFRIIQIKHGILNSLKSEIERILKTKDS